MIRSDILEKCPHQDFNLIQQKLTCTTIEGAHDKLSVNASSMHNILSDNWRGLLGLELTTSSRIYPPLKESASSTISMALNIKLMHARYLLL